MGDGRLAAGEPPVAAEGLAAAAELDGCITDEPALSNWLPKGHGEQSRRAPLA